jgi:hypothetical protein
MKTIIIYPDHPVSAFDGCSEDQAPKMTPLEDILSSFLEMIERKRISPISIHSDVWNPEEPKEWEESTKYFSPWILPEDDEKIVDDTLLAWNHLLSVIEARIPGFVDGEHKTYEDERIDACDIHGYFIKKFLKKARIPPFQFVAPGLRLASPAELDSQLFKDIDLGRARQPWDMAVHEYKWYPFLFLRADQKLSKEVCIYNDYPWANIPEVSTGLYLVNTKTTERADGCKLLLPFSISEQGFARFGDGKVISAPRQHDGLYQSEWSLIVRDDKLRVELLFKNWADMIEGGHWGVDENGVTGGIQKFREADTSSKWDLYQIQRAW